jgi:hypothetical protein
MKMLNGCHVVSVCEALGCYQPFKLMALRIVSLWGVDDSSLVNRNDLIDCVRNDDSQKILAGRVVTLG